MSPTERYSLALSLGVGAVALALLAWQRWERSRRGHDLSTEDSSHFARQDFRRWVVGGVMLLLAGGIYFGSRLEPRLRKQPNVWFVEVWFSIFLLVILLLVLALVDWFATRRYARRHRNAIVREGLEILRDEIRLRDGLPTNGQSPMERGAHPHD